MKSAQEASTLIRQVALQVNRLPLPSAFEAEAGPAGALRLALAQSLELLAQRLDEGPATALRVVFFGPTGTGKSKLFNSLLGEDVSASGFRRPYTMRSVAWLHESRRELLQWLHGGARFHEVGEWQDLILIDTPDFDSVEAGNQREAERVFHEADVFLFVSDVQKYADQAAWTYLERIAEIGKPLVLILNKVAGGETQAEYFKLLDERLPKEARGLARIVVQEYPIDDATLLPDTDSGLRELRDCVLAFLEPPAKRQELLVSSFSSAHQRAEALWSDVADRCDAYAAGLETLTQRLDARYQRGALGLEKQFEASIDASLKNEVFSRVLERLEKLDVLRYPRKILALPFEGVRSLYRWWRPAAPEKEAVEAGEDISAPESESFRVLEGLLLRLAEESRKDFVAEKRCPHLLGEAEFFALPIGRGELQEMYSERMQRFSEWLRLEAQEAAASVTGEHKAKFLISQVIYNSAIVGVQIHTAGFSGVELLADSIVSPLVAKGVGLALSSERVRWFEKKAHAEYHGIIGEIVKEAHDRFSAHLEAAAEWKPAFEETSRVFDDFRQRLPEIESLFVEPRPVLRPDGGS